MATALVALGSNLGDRRQILETALAALAAHSGIRLVAKSTFHSTRPIGGPPGQDDFLNAAARLETSLAPQELHSVLKAIEMAAGRVRAERWAPRTLDLDLLLYDRQMIETTELTVPHPRMAFRRFVLEPAAEIAPGMRHPTIGWTIDELRNHTRMRTPYVAAIAGPIAEDKTAIARAASAALAGQIICDPEPTDVELSNFLSSRLSYEKAVELLELRARPIRVTAWASTAFMTISDYWFPDSGFHSMPSDKRGEYISRFAELTRSVSQPKLVAILESSASRFSRVWWREAGRPSNRAFLESLIGRTLEPIAKVEKSLWGGPMLFLDSGEPEAALKELVAAIQSMQ